MVIWQWELGQLCLLPGYMNFTHAPVTLVYTCRAVLICFLFSFLFSFLVCFEHRQKSLKSLVKSNVTSRLCCTKSTEEEEEDVRGEVGRGGQYNGWPEQYITLLQICFIRIHNKHHDHTLTWESCTYMPVKNEGISFFFFSFFSGLQFLANCYNILLWKKVHNWMSKLA